MACHLQPLDSTCDPCIAFLPGTKDALVLAVGLFFFFFFLCVWLYWVFVAARGLSLVAVSKGFSLQCLIAERGL